jgi:hypothetical protein
MMPGESEKVQADAARLRMEIESLSGIEREVMKRIVGSAGMGGGDEYWSFKRDYYNHLAPAEQDTVRQFLARIFPEAVQWPFSMGRKLVTVCSDLELSTLRGEMQRVIDIEPHDGTRRSLRRSVLVFDLDIPAALRFMFTELYHRDKTEGDYQQFRERFSRLGAVEQQHVRDVLIQLVAHQDEFVAKRAVLVLALIAPASARPLADRLWPDEASKRLMPKDLKRFLGESST